MLSTRLIAHLIFLGSSYDLDHESSHLSSLFINGKYLSPDTEGKNGNSPFGPVFF